MSWELSVNSITNKSDLLFSNSNQFLGDDSVKAWKKQFNSVEKCGFYYLMKIEVSSFLMKQIEVVEFSWFLRIFKEEFRAYSDF